MQNKYLFQIFGRDKYQRYVQSIKTLYDFGESIIITRREELLKNLADTSNEKSAKESNLLLDLLLRSTIDAEPLTNQQILEEVSTFIFGVRLVCLDMCANKKNKSLKLNVVNGF